MSRRLRLGGVPLELPFPGLTSSILDELKTVLGLLPMAISHGEGSELRAPMALTVIGGLLIST